MVWLTLGKTDVSVLAGAGVGVLAAVGVHASGVGVIVGGVGSLSAVSA